MKNKVWKVLNEVANINSNNLGFVAETLSFKDKLIFRISYEVSNGTNKIDAYIMDKQGCFQFVAGRYHITSNKNKFAFCSYVADASVKEANSKDAIKLMKEYLEAVYSEFLTINA